MQFQGVFHVKKMHLLIVSENFRIILSKSNLNISLIYLPQNG